MKSLKKIWVKWRINKSLFWKYFQMMLCIVLLSAAIMLVNVHESRKTITDNFLMQAGENLLYNSEKLSNEIYSTSLIPGIVEKTQYYKELISFRGETAIQHYALLPSLGSTLKEEIYLLEDTAECVLYFSQCDAICSRKRNFPEAKDCFEEYIEFEDVDADVMIQTLEMGVGDSWFPTQGIAVNNQSPVQALTYISKKKNSGVSIMVIYPKQVIMDALGLNSLPEGTCLTITAMDGTVLLQHPAQIDESLLGSDYCQLNAVLQKQNTQVSLWIPKDYFEMNTQKLYQDSLSLVVVMVLLGLACCIVFSRIAVRPIQNLIATHLDEEYLCEQGDELQWLENTMERSNKKVLHFQRLLASYRFSQVLDGHVLSKSNEELLCKDLAHIDLPYRIALLHKDGNLQSAWFQNSLTEVLEGSFVSEVVGEKEIGIIFHGNEHNTEKIMALVHTFGEKQLEGELLHCGISGKFSDITQIYVAVRQARFSMSRDGIPGSYVGAVGHQFDTISWLQHERLYQAITTGDEETAQYLLRTITNETYRGSAAKEVFYTLSFVLHNAASELELTVNELDGLEYDPSLLSWENIDRLAPCVHALFTSIREKKTSELDSLQESIMQYIEEGYADSNFCVNMVAQHFQLSEKKVYAIVKGATGLSFNKYVLSLRMRKASNLLCSSNLSVIEVANMCGYPAESTFYRIFRNYYERTPKQYRCGNGDGQLERNKNTRGK